MALTDNTTGGRIIMQGICPVRIALSDTVEVGDLLGISSSTWVRALATTGGVVHARMVAGQSGVSGDVIVVYPFAVVGGVTGATLGGAVYNAEAALKGEYTQTAPSTTGDVNAPIGIALTETEMFIHPGTTVVYHDSDHLAA